MMRHKYVFLITCLPIMLFAQIDLPAKARITGDFVKVRSVPSTEGKLVGILYKNMAVSVVEQSEKEDSIGTNVGYWYKVTFNDVLGWTYAPFLDFDLEGDTLDTYASGLGMDWFYKRYSYSTWEMEQHINITSFTLDEYRALIHAVMSGGDYNAEYALYYSIYTHQKSLKEKGSQPPFPYLKEKLYSREFIREMVNTGYVLKQYLPDSLKSEE